MPRVQMTYQVPIPLLYHHQGDFDFALAHLVNFNSIYAKFYREQVAMGRVVMLDNSIHELGYPLTLDEIKRADDALGGCTYIIPPDWHGDRLRTQEAVKIAMEMWPVGKVVPVVQGRSLREIQDCYEYYCCFGFRKVAIPYRLREMRFDLTPHDWMGHHFLSFTYVNEIYRMRRFPDASCDTGKPFRFAQNSREIPIATQFTEEIPKLDMNKADIDSDILHFNLEIIESAAN